MSWFRRKKQKSQSAKQPEVENELLPADEGEVVEIAQPAETNEDLEANLVQIENSAEIEENLNHQDAALAIPTAQYDEDFDNLGRILAVEVKEPTTAERIEEALANWRLALKESAGNYDFLSNMRSVEHLDLSYAHPQGLAHLFASREATRLSMLVRDEGALTNAQQIAKNLHATALSYAQERGLNTCFVGIGQASWNTLDGASIEAPILLRPVSLKLRGTAREIELDVDAAVELNPVVLKALRDEGVLIDARALLDLTQARHGFDSQPVLEAFKSLGEPLKNFQINQALIIGNLVDATGPILADLSNPASNVFNHPLLAALAKDPSAQAELENSHLEIAAKLNNPQTVAAELSELNVTIDSKVADICAQLNHTSTLAVQIPPGADSSDLIAQIVAEKLAASQRVLVVAQRSKLLSSIQQKLSDAGLSELLLDLMPSPTLQRRASDSILFSLAKASSFIPPVDTREPAGLKEAGQILQGHAAAMHLKHEPWEVSAHEAINNLAKLTQLKPAPQTSVRLKRSVAEAMKKDPGRFEQLLMQASDSGALRLQPDDCAWFGAAITSDEQAQRALELVTKLVDELIPKAMTTASELQQTADLKEAKNVQALHAQITVMQEVEGLLRQLKPQAFNADIEQLIAALADKNYRQSKQMEIGFAKRRKLRSEARELLSGDLQEESLLALFKKLELVQKLWVKITKHPTEEPKAAKELKAGGELIDEILKAFDELALLLAGNPRGTDFERQSFTDLQSLLLRLKNEADMLTQIPAQTRAIRDLEFEGLLELFEDLRKRQVPEQLVLKELELAWWISVLEFIASVEPMLNEYDGLKLSKVAERFRKLDESYIAAGKYRIRQLADDLLVAKMKQFPDTSRAAIRELSNPHSLTVRDIAAKYEDIIFRARPLWLTSPYMVSQMLPAGELFDLVIVADASRLPTEAAITAIARGKKTLVMGDTFDYPGELKESLLDEISTLAPVYQVLQDTHPATGGVRRFVANRAMLSDPKWAGLKALASPETADDDAYIYVPESKAPLRSGKQYVESTAQELQRIVDLVIFHARHNPLRSLGVITITSEHAAEVQAQVLKQVSDMPDLSDFFNPARSEYFTVVPISAAGAIQRDDIIFSIGFALTAHSNLIHSFGPLSAKHGRKILMSALTKARERTSVVTSLHSSDFDPSSLKTEGAKDLYDFLKFLESGFDEASLVAEEDRDIQATENDKGLLIDLAKRLSDDGYQVQLDYGLGSETVELAIAHPKLRGRYLVAVTTDGPQYQNLTQQRERDRLQAEWLEKAGWYVERVWSWALFIDPAGEAQRVKKTVERAYQDFLDLTYEEPKRLGSSKHRLPRPKVPTGHQLSYYSAEDFDAVVEYICSDGKARYPEQLAAEVREYMGFDTRSVLLDVTVSAAIRRYQESLEAS